MPETLDNVIDRHWEELEADKNDLDALANRQVGVVEVLAMDDIGHKALARSQHWQERPVPEAYRQEAQDLALEYEKLAREVATSVQQITQGERGASIIAQAVQELADHVGETDLGLDHAGVQGHLAQIVRLTRLVHGSEAPPEKIHGHVTDLLHAEFQQRATPTGRHVIDYHVSLAKDHPHAYHPGHRNPHAYH